MVAADMDDYNTSDNTLHTNFTLVDVVWLSDFYFLDFFFSKITDMKVT